MWQQELEDRIVPVAVEAARSACLDVDRVELRFENGGIKVVVNSRPTETTVLAVQTAVRQALDGIVADPKRLRISVSRGFPLLYTSHLTSVSQVPQSIASLQSATRFTVRLSELYGLRSTYDWLVEQASEYDYVATTALGGIPGLLHLVSTEEKVNRPEEQESWPSFYGGLRDKYHLFPGLLWSRTDKEALLFFNWIRQLRRGATVLLFDTGTVGNGARRFLKVLRERCDGTVAFGPALVTIAGVVDGEHSSQRFEDEAIPHTCGSTRAVLTYRHVPRVLSEDCQELIGFDSVRPQMMYRSVSANAVIEVVTDSGEHLQSLAAASGASALRSLILKHVFPAIGDREWAEDATRFLGGMILCHGVSKERQLLKNAVQSGLVDPAWARERATAAEQAARLTFEKDLIPQWDFEAKRKSRKNCSPQADGGESGGAAT